MGTLSDREDDRLHTMALLLAGTAILWSAMHFWPFHDSRVWERLCRFNPAPMLWCVFIVGYGLARKNWRGLVSVLPHVSVLAYLAVNLLSVAFSSNAGRTFSFSGKLILMFVGGYTLFGAALSTRKSLRVIYALATAAVALAVSYRLVEKFVVGLGSMGLYDSVYKYDSYMGTLAPLCGAYLLTSQGWKRLAGVLVVAVALISASSLGGVVAITVGIVTLAIVGSASSVRGWALAAIALGLACAIALDPYAGSALRSDVILAETDGEDLKQRYIEWQAEINLLEERAAVGTGAGCINEYRSGYYFRLPKLNTLQAFDQNGWLATGAETGILGLICFCWVVGHYFGLAWQSVISTGRPAHAADPRFAGANLAGLAAACTANLFSSVYYYGVLIAFVLVLALIARTNRLLAET